MNCSAGVWLAGWDLRSFRANFIPTALIQSTPNLRSMTEYNVRMLLDFCLVGIRRVLGDYAYRSTILLPRESWKSMSLRSCMHQVRNI